MLSIGAMGHGQGQYYIELAQEDYYTAGGEAPGRWLGQGAAALGLIGVVEKEAFSHLLSGYAPEGTRALIQNAGDEKHQPGWDLTFSAPKSVSTLWSQADEATQRQIQEAQAAAVKAALGYLEETAAYTRRGQAGREREAAGLVVATFEHGTSRAQDPQLHTHALILNVGTRADGTTGTLVSKPFYEHKMTAGALYRAELAAQLEQRLGLEIERRGNLFEVQGVSQALREEFSTRRREIEAVLQDRGWESAAAAAMAALTTREVKQHVAREVLLEQWQEVGRQHGFSQAQVQALLGGPRQVRGLETARQDVLQRAVERVTEQDSYFTERDLVRRAAEEAPGRGLGAAAVREGVRALLQHNPEIISLGRVGPAPYYTTREMRDLEQKLLAQVEASREDRRHLLGPERVAQVLQAHPLLKPEQRQAVEQLTGEVGSLQVLRGLPGTTKTTVLGVAREVWEAEGYTVVGAALAGKAARGLQTGAGIPSDTLHRRLGELEKGTLRITERTVFVVDEAGMVGTRPMARVVEAVQQGGANWCWQETNGSCSPLTRGARLRPWPPGPRARNSPRSVGRKSRGRARR
jgi:conjugative relaxase-like TrwC/TraI family protein